MRKKNPVFFGLLSNHFFVLLILLFCVLHVHGKEDLANSVDSVIATEQVYGLSEVSIKSAETQIKTRKIIENLISDEAIQNLKIKNDSILYVVDTSIVALKKTMVDTKSIRYLENKKLRLAIQQEKIELEKAKLSKIVNDLGSSITFITEENSLWKHTLEIYIKDNHSAVIVNRLKNITSYLDSSVVLIAQKNEVILSILDSNTELSIEIQELMDKAVEAITQLESRLFKADHPNFFKLPFSDSQHWKLDDKIRRFFTNDYYELEQYFKSNKIKSYITVILFFFFLYVFITKRKFFIVIQPGFGFVYKENLLKIILRPISAAIIITLMFSILIFTNRPLAFRDLSGYVVIIPLLLVLRSLVQKRYYYLVNTMAILIIPYILFIMLPPENIVFRINIVLISVLESYLMFRFLYVSIRGLEIKRTTFNLLRFFGYLFFVFSIVGFISSITGNLMLAEIMLLTVFISLLAGELLFISTMLINGLLLNLIESERGQKLNFIRNNSEKVKSGVTNVISFGSVVYWIYILLGRLKIETLIIDSVSSFLTEDRAIGSVTFTVGTIITFFVVIYLSIVISNIVRAILADDVLDKFTLPKGMRYTIAVVVKYTLITAGVFLAVSAAGMDFSSLTVIIGAFGVGIGFGLQTIFNNLVSGLILLLERPIQIGDTIEVGTLIGEVKSIGIRSSNVRTFDGAEVIVPNGNLISSEVVNWTLSDQRRRIEIIVGVSYASDPHLVHDLLDAILSKHNDVLKEPEPVVRFNELGESSLDFRLLFWTSNFGEWIRIRSDIIFEIFDVLKQHNVEIPFPQRDVHVRSIEEVLKIKKEGKDMSTEKLQ